MLFHLKRFSVLRAFSALLGLIAAGCTHEQPSTIRVEAERIAIDFNAAMHSRVVEKAGEGRQIEIGDYQPSEYVNVNGREIRDFAVKGTRTQPWKDGLGTGRRNTITGTSNSLSKELTATVYDAFPSLILLQVRYTNRGASPISVDSWTNHHYEILASRSAGSPSLWSYQSGSYERRPAWVVPLQPGFSQQNYLGMNATDYGGGTPVVDVWRHDAGIGVGHVELAPKQVSLPVQMPDAQHATVAVTYKCNRTLQSGESLDTFRTFVSAHRGDYFETLVEYRRLMVAQGVRFADSPEDAFGPIWCAWGYGRKFMPAQIFAALPMVKRLGFRWVTLDDGWQTSEGDWHLNREKFPRGDADMKAMVDRIHAGGFKAQLWWAPLAVDPGTDLIKEHPEQLLLNEDGSRRKITWWNSYYLCPADPAVRRGAVDFVRKAIREWGFDGLKIDGQHLNGAPPCYNPAHHHAAPTDSVEGMPGYFKAIHDAALEVNPNALIEICPCGTSYSFFTLPFLNMAVASDPENSWQIRTKAKTLKALMGDSIAYFGDHVEMSDGGDDYASTVGVGGVVGTNFTWPVGSGPEKKLELTPEREEIWAKWLGIYKAKMLPRGQYLGGLYDIGFDRPEAHAIRSGDKLYYAFYAKSWQGEVELRGLGPREYHIVDYENGKDLGNVKGPAAKLGLSFEQHLLLEAEPR